MMRRYILLTLLWVSYMASAQVQYLLDEGFEQGLPDTWIQECRSVEIGELKWTTETGSAFANPATCYEGNTRMLWRPAKTNTTKYVQRLITPAMDLTRVLNPQLIFSHAQVKYNACDTLAILYRTTATAQWKEITRYTTPIATWKTDTLSLPEAQAGTAYQIAFEARANLLSYGIVLDAVKVRAESHCKNVLGVTVSPASVTALIQWQDAVADYFDVLVEEAGTVVFQRSHVPGYSIEATGLEGKHDYIAYVRSECEDSETGHTEWVSKAFTTTLGGVPYYEPWDVNSITSETWHPYKVTMTNGIIRRADLQGINKSALDYIYTWHNDTVLRGLTGFTEQVARVKVGGNGSFNSLLESPSLDLTQVPAGTYVQMTFLAGLSAEYNPFTEKTQAKALRDHSYDDRLLIMVSTDDGETYRETTATSWTADGQGDYDLYTFGMAAREGRVDLTPYVGKVIRLGIYTESNIFKIGATTEAFLYLDDIRVDTYDGACGGVRRLTAEPAANSVTLTWQKNGTANQQIELSTSPYFYTVQVNAGVDGSTTSHTFTYLYPNTTYYARVRQLCDDGDGDWQTVSFTTTRSIPYEQKFPGYASFPSEIRRYYSTSADDLISGAVSLRTKEASNYGWDIRTVKQFDYSPAAYMEISGTSEHVMALPVVSWTAQQGTNVRLTFKVALSGRYDGTTAPSFSDDDDYFAVLISDDGGRSWQNLMRWDCAGTGQGNLRRLTNSLQQIKIPLGTYTGKTVQIAFAAGSKTSGSDNYVFVDDIYLGLYDAECGGLYELGIRCTGPTSAALYWQAVGSYEALVEVSRSKDFTTVEQSLSEESSYMSVTGLAPNTHYYFRVRQDCQESEWQVLEITTPCDAVSVPYTENFDVNSYRQDGTPECWRMLGSDGATRAHIQVDGSYSFNKYARSGTKCLAWGTSTEYAAAEGSVQRSWAVLPAMDDIASLELSFWARTMYSNGRSDSLVIGVMSDPTDTTSFVAVRGIRPTNPEGTNPPTYQQYFVDFSTYKGVGKYIAIMRYPIAYYEYSEYDYYAPMIDDIEVKPRPTCDRISAVTIDQIQAHSLRVSYPGTGAAQYQVVVSTAAMDTAAIATHPASIVYDDLVSTTAVTISSLEQNTEYFVYVRGCCDGGLNSPWSKQVSARTNCDALTQDELGIEHFDREQDMYCWHFGFRKVPADAGTYGCYARRHSDTQYGNYIQLSKASANTPSYAYVDGAYAVTPELNVADTLNRYQVTFRAATTHNDDALNQRHLEIGIVTDPEGFDTYEKIAVISLDYAADSTKTHIYRVPLDSYEGDYNGQHGRHIVFYSEGGDDSTNYVLIDDVRIEPISYCRQVQALTLDTVGQRIATLHWEDLKAPEYQLALLTERQDPDTMHCDAAAISTITSPQFSLTELLPGTEYYVYVRAVCGEEDTALWSNPVAMKTYYGVPYLEPFDTEFLTDEWHAYSQTFDKTRDTVKTDTRWESSILWQPMDVTTVTGMEGTAPRIEIGNGKLLVSPMIDLSEIAEGEDIEIHFLAARVPEKGAMKAASDQVLHVYISTDGGRSWNVHDRITWTSDDTGDYDYNSIRSTATRLHADITRFAGRQIHMGFYSERTGYGATDKQYLYIDSIGIDRYDATCLGIQRLAAEVSGLSATLTWQLLGTPLSTDIEIARDAAFSDIVATETIDEVTTYTVSGLNYSTTYYARARQHDCTEQAWTPSVNFRTPWAVDYAESLSSLPGDWTRYRGEVSNAFAGTLPTQVAQGWSVNTSGFGLTSSHLSLRISNTCYWLVSPTIYTLSVPEGKRLALQLDLAYTRSGSYVEAGAANQTLWLLISEDEGQSWTAANAYRWGGEEAEYLISDIPVKGKTYELDLSRFADRAIRIALASGSEDNYNELHVGNFSLRLVDATVAPPAPVTNLAARDITIDSATVSWRAAADSYELVWREGDTIRTTGKEVILTGLEDDTEYQICVRAMYSGNASEWECITIRTKKDVPPPPPCYGITSVLLMDLYTDHATLQVTTEDDEYLLSLIQGTDTLSTQTYTTASVTLSDLTPETDYRVFVRSVCDSLAVETRTTTFTTLILESDTVYEVRYEPSFEEGKMPSDWRCYKGWVEDVWQGESLQRLTHGWELTKADTMIAEPHFKVDISGTGTNLWLVSPTIDLTANVGEGLRLCFYAGFTTFSKYYDHNDGMDDRFIVMVSTDNGESWSRENATIWDNSGEGDYGFNAMPSHPREYTLDLSHYAGTKVRLGFYAESTEANGGNTLHLGRIVLDKIAHATYTEHLCEGDYYEAHGFSIDSHELHQGLNVFTREVTASSTAEHDSIIRLELTMDTLSYTRLEVTLADSTRYVKDGFDFIASATMNNPQIQILPAASGCDSIVELYVTVLPPVKEDTVLCVGTIYIEEARTICTGSYYQWHGQRLSAPGTYADTLLPIGPSCDTIVTLTLNMIDTFRTALTASLCNNDYIDFEGLRITEPGTYRHTYISMYGCDSVVTMEVTKAETKYYSHTVAICAGTTYSEGVFHYLTLPGEYTDIVPSADGCDSVAHLRLLVADAASALRDTIYQDELPYVINGETLLPVGTPDGIYVLPLSLPCGEGEITITLGYVMGLDEVSDERRARKILINGELYIECGGVVYDVMGRRRMMNDE